MGKGGGEDAKRKTKSRIRVSVTKQKKIIIVLFVKTLLKFLNRIVVISLSGGYILRLNCTLYNERRVMTAL